jgi:serine phosphatase RsbU (regulator of sigma subunit)
MNAQEQYFTLDGILKYLSKATPTNTDEFGRNLMTAVHSFSGRVPQTDDQSIIIVGKES